MMDEIEQRFEEYNTKAAAYARAEAERVQLTEFRKSQKAILMKQAEVEKPGLSAAAQEREAYAHPDYVRLLEGLQYATEVALKLKFELHGMQMRFDYWRTRQATRRAEMGMR